ncbi:MAG: EAL domain-containing protein [Ostreibacterium sp.]
MDKTDKKKTISIIIVSEQLEQINFIEKVLKHKLLINMHQSNQVNDIKTLLDRETIDLVIVDDASGTLGVTSVQRAISDVKQTTPILQLRMSESVEVLGEFIKNGATMVCPKDDALALLHMVELLLSYSESQHAVQKYATLEEKYKSRFDDLYEGLADPVFYLQDGVFTDCNPAFLRAFEVSDKKELEELTILDFFDPKVRIEIKKHLKMSTRRDLSAAPRSFSMKTKLGKEVEYFLMSKPAQFEGEQVIQVYLRSASEGGGAGSGLYDDTTGLANKEQMIFILKQKKDQLQGSKEVGALAYIIIKNYRDIWGTDGFDEAEKFIRATTQFVRKSMPAHTELSRYTDDGLLIFIPHLEIKAVDDILINLVKGLDTVTPEGMVRMIEPICYIGFEKFDQNTDYHRLTSELFKAAHTAILSDGARVARPTETAVTEKDSKRLGILQSAIHQEQFKMHFQPIASFSADNITRYRERLVMLDDKEHPVDLATMLNLAERYNLAHHIDKWKINTLFDKLLTSKVDDRQSLLLFIVISVDSLNNLAFVAWLLEQMEQTGLGGGNFVFEVSAENVQHAYTATIKFAKVMRQQGAKIAVTKITDLTKDNKRIINDIKPEFIKLDLRDIATLDETEQADVMEDLRDIATQTNAQLIAEYIESPGQLSCIWPYGVKLIQGDVITPVLEEMKFDFGEFIIS